MVKLFDEPDNCRIGLQWWGYLHANGTPQLKRWWGDVRDYTTDVDGNDFVQEVVMPFFANSPSEAMTILLQRLQLPKEGICHTST